MHSYLRNIFIDESNNKWSVALNQFPNRVPRFQSKQEAKGKLTNLD